MSIFKAIVLAVFTVFAVTGCKTAMQRAPSGTVTKYPVPEADKDKYVFLGMFEKKSDGLTSEYLIKTSAKRDGELASIDVLANIENPVNVGGTSPVSSILTFQADCKTKRQFRLIKSTEYSELFGGGQILKNADFLSMGLSTWKDVNKGSSADTIVNAACNFSDKKYSSASSLPTSNSEDTKRTLSKLNAIDRFSGNGMNQDQVLNESGNKRRPAEACKQGQPILDKRNAAIFITECNQISKALAKGIESYTNKQIDRPEAIKNLNELIKKSNDLKIWGDENNVLKACGSPKVVEQISLATGQKNYLIDKYRTVLDGQ